MPLLFSYGTLQQREVQLATFGRTLEGRADALVGFRRTMLEIRDEDVIKKSGLRFHPIVAKSGDPADEVEGQAFEVTEEELKAADAYEVTDYRRVEADLRSGARAFVYVKA